jgi:hypothetical protein
MPTTSNFGWTTPADTDLVKDGAAAIRTLGNGVDASLVDLKGGTTGQILSKASNTDLDYTWITNDVGDITEVTVSSPLTGGGSSGSVNVAIQDGTTAQKGAVQLEDSTSSTSTTKAATPNSVKSAYDLAGGAIAKSLIDAEGDLIVGDAADAVQRLALGSNGNVLTVDTSVDGKIKWAAPASGALVLTGSASPSASANFTITNCFSATYRNYLVVFDGSLTADTLIRFGTNGSANSTSNYTYRGYYNISSLTALNTNQATSFKTLDHGTVSIGGTIRIQSPYATKRTSYEWDLIGVNGSTTALDANLAGFFDDTTSFTDLNFSTSGTFTGNVYVYGLSNS